MEKPENDRNYESILTHIFPLRPKSLRALDMKRFFLGKIGERRRNLVRENKIILIF